MKHFAFLVAALASSLILFSGSASASEPVSLFNSADLNDWDYALMDPTLEKTDVWEFRDGGILYCKGDPIGWLGTKKHYKNYHLTVEYRWPEGVKPTNSGIFNRIIGDPLPLPSCFEYQLAAGEAGNILALSDRAITEKPDRYNISHHPTFGDIRIQQGIARNEKTPGEWNQVEIVCDGEMILYLLNGKLVNWGTDPNPTEGKIGFQAEGGPVEFRNAFAEELP